MIRRPRPSPRQGRRLGPPEVWNFALLSQAKAHAFPRQQLCQLHAPAIYMPLPSVFHGVQDCRLPAFKRSKPFRRPPRQQLLQLHAPAICFSGGSRLPFTWLQTLQTLPQASKATTLTATCPCHLFFRRFKTAVCPPSNAPNPSAGLQGNNSYSYMPLPSLFFSGFKTAVCLASNAPNPSAGLQGNNSYSYMPLPSVFQGVQDCRLPAFKRSKPFRRPPRQQLLQLHAPAICFSGGSRLPFAWLQTLQPLLQASKATTLTATCPKRSKPFRRPPRQQLLQLHAPAICFSGVQDGSRLPFARPQTLQTLPQASKATTLTATCPCHLFFRGFKTAVCPPSNAPNPSGSRLPFARLQTLQTLPQASKATTLTATCPCHLFFRGFKTAVCLASNAPNPSAGLQGNNSYSYMPLPSVFQGVQDCRLPAFKRSKPFRRPPRQQLLQLHAPAICFSGGSRLPFARLQTLQTLPQASKATTLTATCPCHLFFRGFKTVQDCPLPALKRSKPFRRPPRQQLLQLHAPAICFSGGSRLPFARLQTRQTLPQASKATTLTATCPLPSVFQGVQDGFKRSKPFRRPPRQQLLQLHAPAICFSGGSRLPFARPQTLQTLPQASKATTLTATCPCHLFFRGFKTVPDCRLPALKRSKPFRRPPRQQLLQLHAPAICFSGGSRLPFARPQTLQTLPQASKATTLTATCPCHLFFRGFKTAVCPPSNAPNPSAGLQGNNSYSYMPLPSVFQGVQDGSRLPFARPQTLQTLPQASKATTLTATCPCHLFFRGFKTAVCPPSNAPNPSAGLQGNNSYSYMPLPSVFQGVQDCRLPALKRSKPFRRPPRQQLLQLHAPAICFSGGPIQSI